MVALGSNLSDGYGSSEALLDAALARLDQAGLPVLRRSRWWRSSAWPDPSAPEYRNGIAVVEASFEPRSVLRTLFSIEAEFNRNRGERNAPRTLDLDLIAHGRQVIDTPDLTLPHPRAHERLFVMGPLAEIAPGWRHPVSGLSAEALAAQARVGTDARPV
ncbi:MAG: 2-amino-4-hydroxy-6-hydroxymethyldihydropteridine diphosphokinase [Phenylobacterium sp.]|nr:2-amino-4-hydroxy-6-hydroxymethyldihydropteridine diphosphokinase [Phenylobacterium sp.]